MAERLRKCSFYMDSITGNIEGYTFDHYWNGWACPYFPHGSVDEVVRNIRKFSERNPDLESVAVSWDGDVLVLLESDYPDEPERVETALLTYEGEELKLWPLGTYSWTWIESDVPNSGER